MAKSRLTTKLWTAIVTPMQENGEINYQEFESLIDRQSNAGNGIVLLGSTGEGLALTKMEREAIIKYVSHLDLEVPIMVGVNGHNLVETKNWITYCEQFDFIDSYLMPVPLYAKPGPEGQYEWFLELLNTASKPCMLYNVPSRTGAKFSFDTAKKLHWHKNFWALKEASGSLDDFKTFCTLLPDVEVFSGEDSLLPAFSYYGCKGLVSVMSNVWPRATKLYVEKCLAFDFEGLYPTWDIAANSLFVASNPVPTKVILKEKGIIESACLRAPLSTNDMKDLDIVEQADDLVSRWFESQKMNNVRGDLDA